MENWSLYDLKKKKKKIQLKGKNNLKSETTAIDL